LTQCTNLTDGQTDGAPRHMPRRSRDKKIATFSYPTCIQRPGWPTPSKFCPDLCMGIPGSELCWRYIKPFLQNTSVW